MAEGQGGVDGTPLPLHRHFGESELRQRLPPPLRGTPLINAGGKSVHKSFKGEKIMWHDPKNKEYAKQLRQNMTPWERKLWYCFLSSYPVRFQRQKCIDHYIVDFYCFRAKLVIELDGGGHYEPDAQRKDAARTRGLEKYGLKVLRVCNLDIDRNFEGVCTFIDLEVKKRLTGT